MLSNRRTKVVCLGLGKTGTTTFSKAMIELGYRHCGHAARLPRTFGINVGTKLALKYYDSFDDFPWPFMYERIRSKYPDTKFVLTRRRSSSDWLKSLNKAYCRKGPTLDKFKFYGYFSPYQNPKHHVQLYEGHLSAVRNYFKGNPNLLEVCWEEGDGWEELCGFLGVSVPKIQFPIENRASNIDYDAARTDADRVLLDKLSRRTENLG